MVRAGIRTALIALRRGKWDVPAVLGDGSSRGLRLGYVIVDSNQGVPFTVDAAHEFVRGRTVVFGYPDLLMTPPDLLVRVLDAYERTGADAVLALLPAGDPRHMDLVDLDANGEVRVVRAKPAAGSQTYTWVAAVWGPAFTEHLRTYVEAWPGEAGAGTDRNDECEMADVLNCGIRSGLRILGEQIPGGRFVDIGRPESLAGVLRGGPSTLW
jgi:glucose-1-phosphate thymidylyltransferase